MKKKIFLFLILHSMGGFVLGMWCIATRAARSIMKKQEEIEKNYRLYQLSSEWVKKKQKSKSIKNFIEKYRFNTIAVYGMGNLGECLIGELKQIGVKICYGIDRREILSDFPIYKIEDILPEVDVIIVTPIYEFEEIAEELKEKVTCPVYSLEDIIYFME